MIAFPVECSLFNEFACFNSTVKIARFCRQNQLAQIGTILWASSVVPR